jgi:hypothetical protein
MISERKIVFKVVERPVFKPGTPTQALTRFALNGVEAIPPRFAKH